MRQRGGAHLLLCRKANLGGWENTSQATEGTGLNVHHQKTRADSCPRVLDRIVFVRLLQDL